MRSLDETIEKPKGEIESHIGPLNSSNAIKQDDLPAGVKLVTKPITVPTSARSGELLKFLNGAVELTPTTIETGLCPHFEWPFETAKEMRSKVSGLQIARRKLMKRDPRFRKLSFMQRTELREGKKVFMLYVWMDAGV